MISNKKYRGRMTMFVMRIVHQVQQRRILHQRLVQVSVLIFVVGLLSTGTRATTITAIPKTTRVIPNNHRLVQQQQQQRQRQASTSTTVSRTMDELMERLTNDTIELRNYVQELLLVAVSSNDTSSIILSTSTSNASSCFWTNNCMGTNYHHCFSKFPNETCIVQPYNDPQITTSCSSQQRSSVTSQSCSTKFDYTVSTVRLSDDIDLTPSSSSLSSISSGTDNYAKITEVICQSSTMDTWFQTKQLENIKYYTTNYKGYIPLSMHFGTPDGIHRIYPGRTTDEDTTTASGCKNYDPRIRPWYTAASSVRRNVQLVLDISLSMIRNSNRLSNMITAVKRIITSTTLADTISLIIFDNMTHYNTGFYTGTSMNQQYLITMLSNLSKAITNTNYTIISPEWEPSSTANYTSVMNETLSSISNAYTTKNISCSTAILIFTDGIKSKVSTLLETIQSYQTDMEQIETSYNVSLLLFVYSMSQVDITYHTNIDCTISNFRAGIWSQITSEDEIIPGIANYYELFQLAFEQQQVLLLAGNETTSSDMDTTVAWVEPYPFFTFGVVGVTVSAPIYGLGSRGNQQQRQLLGVVGIDYSIHGMEMSTIDYNNAKILDRAYQRNQPCPIFSALSPCDLRFYTTYNPNAVCSSKSKSTAGSSSLSSSDSSNTTTANATNTTCKITYDNYYTSDNPFTQSICCPYVEQSCSTLSVLWNNTDYKGLSYIDRGCCSVDNDDNNDNDLTSNNNNNDNTSNSISSSILAGITTPPFGQCLYSIDPAPTPPSDNNVTTGSSNSSKSISAGAISGIVLGGLVAVAVIGILVLQYHRKRKSMDNPPPLTFSRPPPVNPMFAQNNGGSN